MARTAQNAKLDTRSARAKLINRREPYFTYISKGCSVGYRKGHKGGSWIARFRSAEGKQRYEALGPADDVLDADGLKVLSFSQAQARAREFFAMQARKDAGHDELLDPAYDVQTALQDYFTYREAQGSTGLKADRYAARARIVPALGSVPLQRLSTKAIEDWHSALALSARRSRTKNGSTERGLVAADMDDEGRRARRATANRLLTVLKAALNHAYRTGKTEFGDAWRKVKPFRQVDTAVIRYLSEEECVRLVSACETDFGQLVRGALVTGCRYGELTRLKCADFDARAQVLSIRNSKGKVVRHVALTADGVSFFTELTASLGREDRILKRVDGRAWGASHQQRPMIAASTAARIDPPVTFHVLRHTYASTLAMREAALSVIAAQLGHSGTRMTEKHYAHLAPSYVASVVRATLPALGKPPLRYLEEIGDGTST